MAGKATAWSRLDSDALGTELDPTPTPPLVVSLSCAYAGGLADFEMWVYDTFTFPERLSLRIEMCQPIPSDTGITVRATFQGTYTQFHAWVRETFKHPDRLNLRVTVGRATPEPAPAPNLLASDPRTLKGLVRDNTIEQKTYDHITRSLFHEDKNGAIKALRTATNLGLKDAKDIVERS